MPKLKGGAQKRARAVVAHDFSVQAGDSDTIKSALGKKFGSLADYMQTLPELERVAFVSYVIKQKNMQRVIDYVLTTLKIYSDIEDSKLTTNKTKN